MSAAAVLGSGAATRRRERGLGGLVLAVAAAHAALLLGTAGAGSTAAPRDAGARSVQLRVVGERPHQPAIATAHLPPPVPAAARAEIAAPTHSAALSRSRARSEADEVTTLAASTTLTIAVSDADASYLPRTALTVPPRPLEPVLIDFPSFAGEADHYVGEFEIFIDDTGGVVRVRNAGLPLPPILVDAVGAAFLPARFTPGELEGQPVRSRLRIEVRFETQRPPA